MRYYAYMVPDVSRRSESDPIWTIAIPSLTRSAVGVGLVAVIVFLGALANDFAYDDVSVIVRDPGIRLWAGLPTRLLEPWWPSNGAQGMGLWRPVMTGLWGFLWLLTEGNPVAFHAVGVAAHGLVSSLLVIVIGAVAPVPVALGAGLVFAVHPVHVEAIANIVGNAEVLAGLFALLACLAWLRGGDHHRPRTWLTVALAYGVALLSKESAAPLPAVLLLLDAARMDLRVSDLPAYLRRRGASFAALTVVLLFILYARSVVLKEIVGSPPPLGAGALTEIPRAWTLAGTWTHYIRLLVLPWNLSSDYSPAVVPVLYDLTPLALFGAAQVVGILTIAWIAWTRGLKMTQSTASSRAFTIGVLWIGVMLLPVANVVFLSGVLLSERSLYLPSMGFALAFGWCATWLLQRRPGWAVAIVVIVVGLMAGKSIDRTRTWRNTDTVVQTLRREHPESGRAQWVLGNELFAEGRPQAALRAFAYAIGTLDSDYPVLVDLGTQLGRVGRTASSEAILRLAWRSAPDRELAPRLLVNLLRNRERNEEAVEVARAALRTATDSLLLMDQLAVALSDLGRYQAAIRIRGAILRGVLGERSAWWVAQAEDLAALGDASGVRAALDSARVRARNEGGVAQDLLVAAEERIRTVRGRR